MHDESESWQLEPDCLCGLCIKAREGILDKVVGTVRDYVNKVDGGESPDLAREYMVEVLKAVLPLI